MSVTQEEIQKIAESLVKLSPKNLGNLTVSSNAILDYFEMLNEVDTQGVKATVNVVEKKNTLRTDKEAEKNIAPKDLLACSQQKVVWGQIAIANIMN